MADFGDTLDVYVAWTNSDLTEGRGHTYPLVVCEEYETAVRLAMGAGVQGSDCKVTKETAVAVNKRWCAPVRIIHPSIADIQLKQKRGDRAKLVDKALNLGLTLEEIEKLRNG